MFLLSLSSFRALEPLPSGKRRRFPWPAGGTRERDWLQINRRGTMENVNARRIRVPSTDTVTPESEYHIKLGV